MQRQEKPVYTSCSCIGCLNVDLGVDNEPKTSKTSA